MTSVPQDLLLDLYSRVEDAQCWGALLDRVCADLAVQSAVVQRMNAGDDECVSTTWLGRDRYSEENSVAHDAVIADQINPRMRLTHLPPGIDSKPVLSDNDFPGLAGTEGTQFCEALRSIGRGSFMSSGASYRRATVSPWYCTSGQTTGAASEPMNGAICGNWPRISARPRSSATG